MKPSSGLVLPWFLLISVIAFGLETMAEATQQTEGRNGSGRRWWDLQERKRSAKIKEDMPMAVLRVLPENSFVTMDFNQRRVRIFVDESCKVVKTPRVDISESPVGPDPNRNKGVRIQIPKHLHILKIPFVPDALGLPLPVSRARLFLFFFVPFPNHSVLHSSSNLTNRDKICATTAIAAQFRRFPLHLSAETLQPKSSELSNWTTACWMLLSFEGNGNWMPYNLTRGLRLFTDFKIRE
ncbi:hypothetical protein H6P81_015219 [Aristolochia fimbriata]|uniref:Uncharacterized protein n=1 Tax=Aristolochia fimbriata TaxID=158543 RepID=A0AAV7E5I7_ARIFI|nr:hypothetical protein H6P81_015219 [Aristolochia fimbriata]